MGKWKRKWKLVWYYRGYIGILGYMYWGYSGIMEKKMETTILGYIGGYMGGLGFRGLGFRRLGFRV